MNARIRAHRTVDLAAIRAVGFDLDHTLALYDDAAVNLIAANAARRLLVEQLHYPAWLAEATSPMLVPPAARALAADLRLGAIVKLDAARRVRRARLAGRWLTGDETSAAYPDGIPDSREWNYPVYSPFQLPVLWLLEEIESRWPAPADRRERCEHVRSMLDLAHTNGTLKSQLRDDVGRFVS
ncbi:MAG TPA: 5'-nucleotidase domain-containing protein, partial [Candidatus Krumholzibacteria bacterium]|nr:5'-nucleotidase domain-containing protein [Candidatus Krumholzibacteria bacterium]